MIAKTVSELISALQQVDQTARVYTIAPPFDGVRLVKQNDGAFLICQTVAQTDLARFAG